MDPLFDQDSHQDSAPSPQNRPVPGAGAATLGQGDLESPQDPQEEPSGQPDAVDGVRAEPEGSKPVAPEIGGRGDTGESGVEEGTNPTENAVEAPPAEDRGADGEIASAQVPDTEQAASHVGESVPSGTPPETAPADPGHIPDPPTDDAAPPPAWHLPPPPTAVPETATAVEPPAPPGPFAPGAPEVPAADVVSAAPSSAGPGPSRIEPPRRAPARLGRGLASQLRLLVRWPAPVRATPDQRASSLVMLFVLAVTVGVVGSGVLVGLVFLIISALGHGSGG